MPIKKRGGKWYYRFWYQGREVAKSTGLAGTERNRNEALAMEAQARLDLIAGRALYRAPRAQLFSQAAEEYLAYCDANMKTSTATRIRTSFASLEARFGGLPVFGVDVAQVQDYKTWRLKEHGVRPVTLRHDLHTLSAFFQRWALKRNLATSNPVKEVAIPSDAEAQRQHVLSAEEERSYFKHAVKYPYLYDVARLMLLTGCRPDELLSLPQSGVDLERKTLTIAGGKSRAAKRTLPLVDDALFILRARCRTKGMWVFPSPRLEGRHVTKLNNQHDDVCRDAGVSFTIYDLRHTWATRMVTEAGVDVATVAALLGHGSLRTVMRYVHSQETAKQSAMESYAELLRKQQEKARRRTA